MNFKTVVFGLLRPLDYLLENVFPSACLICGRPTPCSKFSCFSRNVSIETCFCPECRNDLTAPAHLFCRRCGRIMHDSTTTYCGMCSPGDFNFTSVLPLQLYKDVARAVVLRMKKDESRVLIRAVGNLYYEARLPALIKFNPDCVVAVPMNWRRKFQRGGINAPEIIAKRIAYLLKIPCYSRYVKRRVATSQQTHVEWEQRFINVYGAFEIKEPWKRRQMTFRFIKRVLKNTWSIFPQQRSRYRPLEIVVERWIKESQKVGGSVFTDKRILLVDDAFTTGSTTNEVARILKESGASEIMVAAIARAGLGKDHKLK